LHRQCVLDIQPGKSRQDIIQVRAKVGHGDEIKVLQFRLSGERAGVHFIEIMLNKSLGQFPAAVAAQIEKNNAIAFLDAGIFLAVMADDIWFDKFIAVAPVI
jgi:hypothetical protein